ncbi:ribosomal protein L1 [Kipferlia bialata]|uniref:Ribosomal protein n=3 Tax=Kipferlia bialata TaxID=797122 RepID=A0A391NT92_9EUKA|nr:ribosomal protein L1 [Kipferlia bialata]|eukprot:g3919.t1
MSRINAQVMEEAIKGMLAHAKGENKRNFLESVEIQIGLKGVNPQRDRRFNATVKLPNNPRPNMKVCCIGNAHDIERATAAGLDCIDMDGLKKFNKDKKIIKKFARKYDAFIASKSVIKMIPRVLGPGLNKAGKFPSILDEKDNVSTIVADIQGNVRFQLKKVVGLNVAVGTVAMTEEELRQNVTMSVNFLVSLLTKNWQNLKVVYLHSTMGPSFRLY